MKMIKIDACVVTKHVSRKCGFLFGLFLLFATMTLAAADDHYVIKKGKAYRVKADGSQTKLPKDFEVGHHGDIKTILVDPTLWEEMEGSKAGIYFFDKNEAPHAFLPFEGAASCEITFSDDTKYFCLSCDSLNEQMLIVYELEQLKKKGSFIGRWRSVWLYDRYLIFNEIDQTKSEIRDAEQSNKGWSSLVAYDVLNDKIFPLKEATSTTDYMLVGMDWEKEVVEVEERIVKDPKDWSDPDKVEEKRVQIPFFSVGKSVASQEWTSLALNKELQEKMNAYISDFTKTGFTDISVVRLTDEDDPSDMIRFSLFYNYMKHFDSRIAKCKTEDCPHGEFIMDAAYCTSTIKELFDANFTKFVSVTESDPPFYYDGKNYHFFTPYSDEDGPILTNVDKAFKNASGEIKMIGTFYYTNNASEKLGQIEALVRPSAADGEKRWVLLSLKSDWSAP